jgi:hypothetical protein
MTRLHSDPVEVRRRDDVPEQFLWRGRLYVVREVLARWTEAGGWWRGSAVRALTAGDAGPHGPAAVIDDNERDWWRVEADSGRAAALSGGRGVYDLCFDWSRGSWSLARVLD